MHVLTFGGSRTYRIERPSSLSSSFRGLCEVRVFERGSLCCNRKDAVLSQQTSCCSQSNRRIKKVLEPMLHDEY